MTFVAGIIAGLLVQNTLKYLLNFGTVTQYLGYASLKDFFPQMQIRANPGCLNPLCVRLQAQYKVRHTRWIARQPMASYLFCKPPWL